MEEYKKKTNTGDDVFIRIQTPASSQSPATAAPTAVLFGWLGSKPRHVAKYATLYEHMGYNTVQTTAPFSIVFPITPRTSAFFVLSVMRILANDDRLTSGGIVFHKFSNGGAVCAPHLSRFFNGQYHDFIKPDDKVVVKTIRDSIAAIVFDSAPVYLRTDLGAQAITEALGLPSGILATIITITFTLLCYIQYLFINLPRYFWDGVRNACYMCPELYIYSRADHLLDVSSLEALINERESQGQAVKVWHVEDAKHVSILRKHPQQYIQTIQSINDWGINVWRKRVSLPHWIPPPLHETPSHQKSDS